MYKCKFLLEFSSFHFCCPLLCYCFWICFISFHPYRNYDFCSRIKNLGNHCRNQKVSVSYKEKKKDHGKIVLLGKTELYTIEALISKVLIKSYISHDVFVSVHNVLREYNERKEEIKNPENSVEYTI